jgi:hypothetical protein
MSMSMKICIFNLLKLLGWSITELTENGQSLVIRATRIKAK